MTMNPEVFKAGDFKRAVEHQIGLCMQESTDLAFEATLLDAVDVRAKVMQTYNKHVFAILQIFKKEVVRELKAVTIKGVTQL